LSADFLSVRNAYDGFCPFLTHLSSPWKQHWIPQKVHSLLLLHTPLTVKHCAPYKGHVYPFLPLNLDWVPFFIPSPWISWPPSS
jgi:hypothetical protein